MESISLYLVFFFFNDTATTEIYPLSLHDALPICSPFRLTRSAMPRFPTPTRRSSRSEEHTSELQSLAYLVCRLLLEKKKRHYEVRDVALHLTVEEIAGHVNVYEPETAAGGVHGGEYDGVGRGAGQRPFFF